MTALVASLGIMALVGGTAEPYSELSVSGHGISDLLRRDSQSMSVVHVCIGHILLDEDRTRFVSKYMCTSADNANPEFPFPARLAVFGRPATIHHVCGLDV